MASRTQNSQTLVMKFGGTSVGSPEAMRQTLQIIEKESDSGKRVVVVTSALSGITDTLLRLSGRSEKLSARTISNLANEIRKRHQIIAEALIPDEPTRVKVMAGIDELIANVVNLSKAIAILGEVTPRVLDAIASTGERMSVRLLAAALQANGYAGVPVEATQLIVTDDHYTDAHPLWKETEKTTRSILPALLDSGTIPVVTGFIAATKDGNVTTLGRGGSDYSAALIGAALPADDVWIFTDVDGVMTADPRLIPEARTVPQCSYREIAELAYFGAKVLHPKTIRPVIEAGIGLRVCNTFNPDHLGTRLFSELNGHPGVIKAITTISDLKLITLEGRGMLGVPGVAARTFETVANIGTSVPLISQASSEQSICFAVPAAAASKVLKSLSEAFAKDIQNRDIDRVWATEEVGIVTVVGEGMRSTPGVAGRIFSALGQNKVNVIAIAQGSSEVSISLIVDAADIPLALRTLHQLI